MNKILLIGAGLSSSSLITYLLEHSEANNWKVRIADQSKELILKKTKNHPNAEAVLFNVFDEKQRAAEIKQADIVISMLPASMHHLVAADCISFNKNMVTASYVSDEIKKLDNEAQKKGLLLLNEIGVDPGIDHMSAMKIIDKIKEKNGKIISFDSNTGGLVAPEFDNNPWHYKFTWNPRNVIVAGQGVSRYYYNHRYKYIPYHKLFTRYRKATVLDIGDFEVYPNRDSIKYIKTYGLNNIETLRRGTMRRPGYCDTWNVFVQLGLTDDTFTVENSENITYRDFINSFLYYCENITVENKVCDYLGIEEDGEIMQRIKWTGIFEKNKIGLKNATPAQILQKLLEEKWKLSPEDKDMIVMQHIFVYEINGVRKQIKSSLVIKGRNTIDTAMSITVGIPVAIATKLILEGKIKAKGVKIPIEKNIYTPILKELENYGINFIEEEITL